MVFGDLVQSVEEIPGAAPYNKATIIPKGHSGSFSAGIQGTWLVTGVHRHDETRRTSIYVGP